MHSACKKLRTGTEAENTYQHLRSIDQAAYDLLASGGLREMLKQAGEYEDENNQYTMSESFKSNPDIDENNTIGLIQATKEQIAARSSIFADSSTMGISLVWDEWLKITQEIIDVLVRRLQVLKEVRQRTFGKT